ncbi:DUF6716 putative glycosyltransferase [Cellulosimicrobium arenosum]|uniref:Uncharacterized protein n=1 Tax=Cellulosimicrobium arenosum TaxID=2708133 RepID=A0A927G7D0_9MICO|nr:DUF6716 putative glycosyltransferase [Cellulosimicrobium arenosum]MBD8078065.1 hypothetical protein [Cellulosimicrobium arenosum]
MTDVPARPREVRVLALADSDSYLKWAAATIDRLPGVLSSVALVRNPIAPSAGQVEAALAGTGLRADDVATVHVARLRAHVRRLRPDVVLVAATGPVVEIVVRAAAGVRPRPALVSGLPGMALPATPLGVQYRSACDAFVVHSRTERRAYAAAYAAEGLGPRIVLEHLPFARVLPDAPSGPPAAATAPVERIVFAAQAKVPAAREQRVAVLDALARAGAEHDVVVKLRAVAGERQTHAEPYPYDALWTSEHAPGADLTHRDGTARVRFGTGPLVDWLGPGSGLVTVSSTAALEAAAVGVPVAVVRDFGVDEEMLNAVFAGSGLLRTLDEVARGELGAPDPAWWAENYGHPEPGELAGVVQQLARSSRHARLPVPATGPRSWRRYVRAWLRCAAPGPLGRAVARVLPRRGAGRRQTSPVVARHDRAGSTPVHATPPPCVDAAHAPGRVRTVGRGEQET